MALLNEINVKGVPHPIVTDDGYYSEMSVGDAEQLISSMYAENSEPYGYRPTGGSHDVGNRAYIDKIVGGTVAWNQLVCSEAIGSGGTLDIDSGVYTLTPNISSGFSELRFSKNTPYTRKSGHKYYVSIEVKSDAWATGGDSAFCIYDKLWLKVYMTEVDTSNHSWQKLKCIFANKDDSTGNGYFCFRKYHEETNSPVSIKNAVLFDLTQMFGSTIADYIYSLEQSQAGAGVAWFKKLFPKDYYEYNAGELLSVEGLQSHDTVGFNQWDEEWEVGGINPSTGENNTTADVIRSTNYVRCLPSTTYYFANLSNAGSAYIHYYDANKNFISYVEVLRNTTFTTPSNAHYIRFNMDTGYGVTYKNDICVNLSDPSRNGEYEPYEKHSYPLDNSLTLRGIPKLDASNNLYYDGDEYASDGKVTRKYGVVDLGSLNWEQNATSRFYAILPNKASIKPSYDDYTNVMCANYESKTLNEIFASNKGISTHPLTGENVWIYDSDYTDGNALKQALQGVMLVYELATPTTETAEPYNEIQICDDFGTEEFVSTGIVPVGHKTRYPANLRDKLQHLPSLASADGTYLIQQSGKQMSLIHMPAVFPEVPTEDGTYVLKATVSGGTPTYVWEDVNAESGVNNYDYTV